MSTIHSIENVKKVSETNNLTEVNYMLDNGWTLLKVAEFTFDDQKELKYVLGWTHNVSVEKFNDQAF